MRAYIFGHILGASEPLTGEALIGHIMETAQSLPGFTLWCRHQNDLEAKVKEWVRCIEASHYFPYGADKLPINIAPAGPSWNKRQQAKVRERITQTVTTLQSIDTWPAGITERFDQLTHQGISGSSLYKHKDLWHPRFTQVAAAASDPKIPPDPPISQEDALGTETPTQSKQAYWKTGCNTPDINGSKYIDGGAIEQSGCNNFSDNPSPVPQQLRLHIYQAISDAQNAQKVRQRSYIDDHLDRLQRDYDAQLDLWENSDDPILQAEAHARRNVRRNDPPC